MYNGKYNIISAFQIPWQKEMNPMTKLDEFIQELCPDGVKYLPIPELFITRNGYTPSKANNEFWENGTIPWFLHGGHP